MSAQLRLSLERLADLSRESFIVSSCNAAAVAALDRWPAWRGGVLALVGPVGSGKTHLAASWAKRFGATPLDLRSGALDLERTTGPLVLEDADEVAHGEALFHLINRAARPGAGLLATARAPPSQWRAEVADLRSRLNALPVAELHQPDDAVLTGLLQKFFYARNIRPSDELMIYLLARIERSAAGAQAVVTRLDEAADAQGRSISRALARQVLDGCGDDRNPNEALATEEDRS